MLHCSLDALLRGEGVPQAREADGAQEGQEDPKAAARRFCRSEEGQLAFESYDAHKNRFALKITVGVALILTGVSALILLEEHSEGIGVFALLSFTAAAVVLFITAGISESAFWRTCPVVPNLYTPEEKTRFQKIFGGGIAAGVAVIIMAVAFMVLGESLVGDNNAAAVFMLMVAGGVGAIVYLGIQHSKYFPEKQKDGLILPDDDNMDEQITAAIEEKVDRELARALREEKRTMDGPDWDGAIMLTATGIFLLAGFLFHAWATAWVVFPLGGILCGIVESLRRKGSKKEV